MQRAGGRHGDELPVLLIRPDQGPTVDAILADASVAPASVRTVDAGRTTEARVLEVAVAHGGIVVVVVHEGAPRSAQLVDALVRARRALDWRREPAAQLTPAQLGLLTSIASGATVPEAARGCFVSERSAFRLLAATRAALGVDTNVEAIAAVRALARPLHLAADRSGLADP